MPSTQYLQVPSVLPHRKSRSRSKSRPREVISVEDNVSPPVNDRRRHHSPPMTASEPRSKPQLNAYTHAYSALTTGLSPNSPYTNGHSTNSAPAVKSKPSPSIETTKYEDLNGDMYTLRDCSTPPPPATRSRRPRPTSSTTWPPRRTSAGRGRTRPGRCTTTSRSRSTSSRRCAS